ncbi:MAG: L-threonylcarbamoyladenylate synthase [Chakrabartia sp.]
MPSTKQPFSTQICPYGEAAIVQAAGLIAQGHCVAVPTETVYGLAADATNGAAVAGIYAAKGRPSFNPLIIHVLDLATAETIAVFDDTAREIAKQFWPGPLTMVLPRQPDCAIASLATAGLETIAIRIPAHPAIQALLKACGKPLAAPSANASGMISPTRADHVLKSLDGRIPMIIDAGLTAHGLESTIIAVEPHGLRLLRPGPIDTAALALTSGLPIETIFSGSIEAPGQLASHYAPSKPLRLEVTTALPDEWLIGFGPVIGNATLSLTGDLVEAAAALFDALHTADASPCTRIALAPIPDIGLGIAINDRLRRAAV